jgi:hypothetical protein
MSELTDFFDTLGVRELVPLMRAIKGGPLGYDFSKRTKSELSRDATDLGDGYAKSRYPGRGYDQALKDFRKILEDQRNGGGGSPGEGRGGKGQGGGSGSGGRGQSQGSGSQGGNGDSNPIKVKAQGNGQKDIEDAANQAANEALKRAKESSRDQIKESGRKADEKFITKSEAVDLIDHEVSQKVSEELDNQERAFRVEVKRPDMPEVETDGLHHKAFKEALAAVSAGLNVLLVGPAGSGKTKMAEQIAEAMGMPFRFTGAVSSEYKLLGFVDAQGRLVRTEYREAYEKGGVFLWDELDASSPSSLLAFNAGLTNGHQDFPDVVVKAHKDFRAIASANTYGNGADRVYVGRNQLDAASLDRFYMITMDYDDKLEKALFGDGEWVKYVWKARKAVAELRMRHVVSMRAIDQGLKMLAGGHVRRDDVERAVLWKHLDKTEVDKVRKAMDQIGML